MNNLLAPNGKPSNLTPEQYKLVRTPAFKEWFGDWENDPENASKVVDENGEPLVLNHSTRKNQKEDGSYEDYFDVDSWLQERGNYLFSTPNSSVNPIFLSRKGKYALSDDIWQIKFFANIKNLFDTDNKNHLKKLQEYTIKTYSKYGDYNEMAEDLYGGGYETFEVDYKIGEKRNKWENSGSIPALISEMGYDAYINNDENVIVVFDRNKLKLADGSNTTFDGNNPDIRFEDGGKLEMEGLSKESIEVIENNYTHIFGFYDYDFNKESESDSFKEWLNNFYKKQFNQNLDVAIEKIESDIQLIKKRKIVDLKLKAFEELIIPTLGNQVLSPKLSQYETMVLMNPSATIESLEKGFQEAKNIIDEDGSLNKYKITPSNLFQDDSINLPNFERFIKANPEYTGVFNDWKKIFDEDIQLTLKDTYAFRYPSLEQLEKLHSELLSIKNNKTTDILFAKGGKVIILPADIQKYKKIGIEDKYFIEASKDVGLQGVNFDSKSLLKKITDEFNTLLDTYDNYLISEDSPSITSYIRNEIEIRSEMGASIQEIERLEQSIDNEYARNQIISQISQTQRATLVQWIDYLRESNYPIPFKFLILKAVLTFNYDLKQNKLFERGQTTIRNFTPFDAGSLSELYGNESDFLLLDYVALMNENSARVLKSQEVIEENKGGKWIKFKGGRNTKSEDIEKNGKELMSLVQNTYWCTKSLGTSQLRGGDFYVYVTETNGEIFPRIAVRMNEDKVGEVRGNSSSAQDLDAEMLPIAETFLNNNIPNDSGKKWLDSIKYNKRCVELRKKIEKEGLYKNFIYDYIPVIADKDKFKVDYGDNGNVTNLIKTFERLKDNLPNEYYNKSDIVSDFRMLNKETLYFIGSLTNYEIKTLQNESRLNMTQLKDWKLKVVSKTLDCSDVITDLGNIEYVGEDLKLSPSTIDLGKLKYIGNNLDMGSSNIKSLNQLEYIGNGFTINSKIKDLGKLKKVGFLNVIACDDDFSLGELEEIEGDLVIKVSDKVIDMGKLKKVGGSFVASKTLITDLKELESIGKNFEINGSKIKVFSNLKTIGGDVDFSNNFTSSTQNIETILGSVKFLNSRIMEFPKLKKIGGSIEFKGSYFKDFGNIEYIGGNLNLAESKVEDLGKLNYVGGFASFKGSKIVSLKKLKQIVGFANFDMSLVEDLGELESIGGNAYFNQTKIKSIGKLNYIGGFTQFQGSKNLEEQWLKKINEK